MICRLNPYHLKSGRRITPKRAPVTFNRRYVCVRKGGYRLTPLILCENIQSKFNDAKNIELTIVHHYGVFKGRSLVVDRR